MMTMNMNNIMSCKVLSQMKYERKLAQSNIALYKQTVALSRDLTHPRDSRKGNNNKCYVKGNMQMFGAISGALSCAAGSVGLYTGLKGIQNMSRIEKHIKLASASITSLASRLGAAGEAMIAKIPLVMDFILSLCNIYMAQPSYRISSMLLNFGSLLVKLGIGHMTNIYKFIVNQFTQLLVSDKTEAVLVNAEVQIDIPTFVSSNLDSLSNPSIVKIGKVLMTLFACSFLALFWKRGGTEISIPNLSEALSKFGKQISGVKTAYEVVTNAVEAAFSWCKFKIFGVQDPSDLELLIEGMDDWFSSVVTLLDRSPDNPEKRFDESLYRDADTIILIESLYKKGLEISRKMADLKLAPQQVLPFRIHFNLLEKLMKQIDVSGAFGSKPRIEPLVLWMFGDSGVGKSGCSWPLAIDLNNIFTPEALNADKFAENIYFRNVEQDFWDNYQGQNVVIYDDFGQLKDSQTNPNTEFIEIIRTANISPYPLHMAELTEKRRTRFTSKVVLLTSNVVNQNVNSLTFPDAFRRRIDLCVQVRNVEGFTKTCFSASKGESVERLDSDKVAKEFKKPISTDVYLFDIVDPEAPHIIIREGITYEELLDLAIERTSAKFKRSTDLTEHLVNYSRQRHSLITSKFNTVNAKMQIEVPTNAELLKQEFEHVVSKFTNGEDLEIHAQNGTLKLPFENVCHIPPKDIAQLYHGRLILNTRSAFYDRAMQMWSEFKDYMGDILSKIKTQFIEHPIIMFGTPIILLIVGLCAYGIFDWITTPTFTQYSHFDIIDIDARQPGIFLNMHNTTLKELKLLSDLFGNKQFNLVCNSTQTYEKIFKQYNNWIALNAPDTKVVIHVEPPQTEASSSGDLVTKRQTVRKFVEANTSGDLTTRAKRNPIILEANQSGDLTTRKPKTPIVIETNTNNNVRTSIVRMAAVDEEDNYVVTDRTTFEDIDLTININGQIQAWKDATAQQLISNKIYANMYKICKLSDTCDVMPQLNGLFVKGRCMLVPGHILDFLDEDDVLIFQNAYNVRYQIPFSEIRVFQIKTALGDAKEACMFVLPIMVHIHADITKHFSDAVTMSKFKRADASLPTLRYNEKMGKMLAFVLGNSQVTAYDKPVVIQDQSIGKDYCIRECYKYNMNTIGGDCGAPLIANETQCLRKILGIHNAGARTGECYAESITQKDLQRTLSQIPVNMQISLDLDNISFAPKVDIPSDVEIDLSESSEVPAAKFCPYGRVKDAVFTPGKTDLRESSIHGIVTPPISKPAYLRNITRNGKTTNIKRENLKKAAMDTPFIPADIVERAIEDVKLKLFANSHKHLRRVFTLEEAVLGVGESEYTGPIARRTSPGYPWINQREGGKIGKTQWLGEGTDYTISQDLRDVCEKRIQQAKLGIRYPTIWTDTLKDERRPIEKVEKLKTRVFANGPMDYTIVFRQYFLGFIANVMENRIGNEQSIGTNVYGRDWKLTAEYLQKKGDKVIAGDFSTFDGTLNSNIVARCVDVINEWYNDGPENALIREVLFSEVYNSIHLCDELLYMWTHSQPSGCPITTVLNSMYNSISMRVVFEIVSQEFGHNYTTSDFDTFCTMVSYGDDNVVNIADEIIGWFNQTTISQGYEDIGMIYTDEGKTGEASPEYRKLDQVAYLKRQFIRRNERVWDAPLDLPVVMEMCNWVRGDIDKEESTLMNVECAIRELSMHPERVFREKKFLLTNALFDETGMYPRVFTYKQYLHERISKYYLGC
nr:MAG: nonstructural polyprotein [Dicistroviridae sp.]